MKYGKAVENIENSLTVNQTGDSRKKDGLYKKREGILFWGHESHHLINLKVLFCCVYYIDRFMW